MILNGNRHNETYIYRRVKWPTFEEMEEYPYITDGSLDFSTNAEMKVTGSLNFEGMETPNTDDLMRVYYQFKDDNGEIGTYPLGTFFVGFSNIEYFETLKGLKSKGKLDANSVLKVLKDKKTGTPYIVNRGQNYIYEAQKIIKQFGLSVDYLPDSQVLTLDHIFEAGTEYLEIVNWLCEQAGYVDAFPDAMGTVILKPLDYIQKNLTTIELENNSQSILYPTIEQQNDFATTPNVVRYMYDTEHSCVIATAKNVSGSRNSIDSMGGREITEFEDIADLPQNVNLLNALMERAKEKVVELSADVEYVNYEHPYIPMQLYQAINLIYGTLNWTGAIDEYEINLQTGTKVNAKLKRVLEQNITLDVTGDIIRNEDDA